MRAATMSASKAAVCCARSDIAYRARLQLWLYLHVPLSIALLAALLAHVIALFFYW